MSKEMVKVSLRTACHYGNICKTFSCLKSGDTIISSCPDEIIALAKLEGVELPVERLNRLMPIVITPLMLNT